jgi:hypothetical protein
MPGESDEWEIESMRTSRGYAQNAVEEQILSWRLRGIGVGQWPYVWALKASNVTGGRESCRS